MLTQRQQRALDYFEEQRQYLIEKSKINSNRLPLSDSWKLKYFENPYLALEDDEYILQRFSDIFYNICSINDDCKVVPPIGDPMEYWTSRFAIVVEELNWRGMPINSIIRAAEQFGKYFSEGPPIGCRMFSSVKINNQKILTKYSNRLLK